MRVSAILLSCAWGGCHHAHHGPGDNDAAVGNRDGGVADGGAVDASVIPVPTYATTPKQTLVAPASYASEYGFTVAVSADGNTLVTCGGTAAGAGSRVDANVIPGAVIEKWDEIGLPPTDPVIEVAAC